MQPLKGHLWDMKSGLGCVKQDSEQWGDPNTATARRTTFVRFQECIKWLIYWTKKEVVEKLCSCRIASVMFLEKLHQLNICLDHPFLGLMLVWKTKASCICMNGTNVEFKRESNPCNSLNKDFKISFFLYRGVIFLVSEWKFKHMAG